MGSKADLRLVGGTATTASGDEFQDFGTTSGLVKIGITDHLGNDFFRANGPPGGRRPPAPPGSSGPDGGSPMTEIAKLQQNVGFLNWAVGIIFVSGLAAMIYLDDRSANRLQPVANTVTEIKIESARQGSKIDLIVEKLDAKDAAPADQKVKLK